MQCKVKMCCKTVQMRKSLGQHAAQEFIEIYFLSGTTNKLNRLIRWSWNENELQCLWSLPTSLYVSVAQSLRCISLAGLLFLPSFCFSCFSARIFSKSDPLLVDDTGKKESHAAVIM